MRKTVDEAFTAIHRRKMNRSFSLVNERLEQVYKGLGEMQSLAVGVGDLKSPFKCENTRYSRRNSIIRNFKRNSRPSSTKKMSPQKKVQKM